MIELEMTLQMASFLGGLMGALFSFMIWWVVLNTL
jgi:hypothetical protein